MECWTNVGVVAPRCVQCIPQNCLTKTKITAVIDSQMGHRAQMGSMGAAPRDLQFLPSSIITFLDYCILRFLHSSVFTFFDSWVRRFLRDTMRLEFMWRMRAKSRDYRFLRSSVLAFFDSCVLRFLSSSILERHNDARVHGAHARKVQR